MKLLLTGSTGAAGSQILRSALADPDVSSITILSRRALPSWLPVPSELKPTEVLVLPDFLQYSSEVSKKLADHDACIWALGTSSLGMSEADYTVITYDYVVKAIEAVRQGRESLSKTDTFRFVFISGEGADPEKQNIQMFGRVKGKTEKYLTTLPPDYNIKGSIFRPGYFFPKNQDDRMNTRGAALRALDTTLAPIFRTFVSSKYTPIEDMGRFAVALAKGRWAEEHTFPNSRMRELIKEIQT